VGDQITIADITWFCTVYNIFGTLIDAEFRKEIPHAVNHFQKLSALPEFKSVVGDLPKFPDVAPELDFKPVPVNRFHKLITITYQTQEVKFKIYADSQATDIIETFRSRFGLQSNQYYVLTDEEGYDVVIDGTLETGSYKLVVPHSDSKDDFVLYYFPLRGRAEASRLIFADTNTSFTEQTIPMDQWQATEKEALTKSGAAPFGQLPRLTNGNVNLVQSNTIIRYLARKLNLYGVSVEEQALVDLWLDEAEDVRGRASRLIFGEKLTENAKADHLPFFEKVFQLMDTHLSRTSEGKGYLIGQTFTVADLSLWEATDVLKTIYPDFLAKFRNIEAWHGRVASRPNIASYLAGKRNPFHF